MPAHIEDRDLGLKRIERELRMFKNSATLVGLFGHGGDPSDDLAARGAVHEYGYPSEVSPEKQKIPERSFMRSTYDENLKAIQAKVKWLIDQIIVGRMTAKKALATLGEYHVRQIKQKITKGPFRPLAEATIRRKKSSRPLIDKSDMRNRVTHREEMRT